MSESRLIKPVLEEELPIISHGKGIYLYDMEGKQYLDGSSGAVTASIGHGVGEIQEAMKEQASKISFVYRSQFTSIPAEKLATKLSTLTETADYYSFLVNSGSEATETAMKIAIQYWQEKGMNTKQKILSRWMSYHGITIGALSMSGHTLRRNRFEPLLEDYPTISPPYCYRCPYNETYPNCQLKCATELEKAINRIGEEHIAAVIMEPIVGAAGAALTPPPGYYEEIRKLCDQYNILFISDEVMTGIGRAGKMLALDYWDTVADIVTLGKGLSAGYTPIAAVLVESKIMEPIQSGSKVIMSGHTFSGNPQSAAAGVAVLDYIEKHNVLKQTEENGVFLYNLLKKLQRQFPIIGDIRGKGLLLGLEFVSGLDKTSFPRERQVTNLVISKSKEAGLLVYPASAGDDGVKGDAIIIAPPLTITKVEIRELVKRLSEALVNVMAELDGEVEYV
ncbi:aspartate aminotransferase family protein [Bacillus suaedaesalsae]|uniref:Aspartate aminotransferase family protein n=1 Tax=Bacillus suaedaesalsae TaxID=2810349 RepID=A0ABS2DLP6_9BACI|nr:aspartate aminotransferase family protein [Bacillus suaedaesalsae]MBM6619368.1 aspartate aminotransferase family protein [Bacillus suaedaesalsae]